MKKRFTAIIIAVIMVFAMSTVTFGDPGPGDGGGIPGPHCPLDPLRICISDIFDYPTQPEVVHNPNTSGNSQDGNSQGSGSSPNQRRHRQQNT